MMQMKVKKLKTDNKCFGELTSYFISVGSFYTARLFLLRKEACRVVARWWSFFHEELAANCKIFLHFQRMQECRDHPFDSKLLANSFLTSFRRGKDGSLSRRRSHLLLKKCANLC